VRSEQAERLDFCIEDPGHAEPINVSIAIVQVSEIGPSGRIPLEPENLWEMLPNVSLELRYARFWRSLVAHGNDGT
jgi:hypothetical protein